MGTWGTHKEHHWEPGENTLGWIWVWDTKCSGILSTSLFLFANSTLAKCKVDIAQFSSWKLSGLHSQVDNSTLLFAKSSSSLHLPTAWMFFFFSLPKLFPQKIRLPPLFSPFFFHKIPRAAPSGLSFLLPICHFLDLWVFEAWEECFQNSNHQINYFLNTLRANGHVLTSDFFSFVSILLWVIWIWSHPNGMGVHPWKTHEISGWNTVHSRNINHIILFHPWSVDIASEGIDLFHKKISIPF